MNRTIIHSKSEADTFEAGKKLASELELILNKKAVTCEVTKLFDTSEIHCRCRNVRQSWVLEKLFLSAAWRLF